VRNFVSWITLFHVALLCSWQAVAATHPADKYLSDCIAANSTTAGMTNCTTRAHALWESELNIKYVDLRNLLSEKQKLALRDSQRQWIIFRDLEFKVIDAFYSTLDGTMYTPMRAADRLEIVKSRVLQLNSYVALIKE
jgi:uncharacterized protein YecT (DUF1311 family)